MFCRAQENAIEELKYGIENAPHLIVISSYTQDVVMMWENINRVPQGFRQRVVF